MSSLGKVDDDERGAECGEVAEGSTSGSKLIIADYSVDSRSVTKRE